MGDWLSDSELEQILKIGWTLAAGRDEKELSAAAVREMLYFVGADEVDYNAVDLKTNRVRVAVFPQLEMAPGIERQLASVVAEHPIIRHLERSNHLLPVRLSDLVSPTQFFRSRIYGVLFRPRDLRYQLVAPVQVDNSARAGAAYAMNRSMRDFDEPDLRRAAAVQPVIAALHAALMARRPTEEQLDAARVRAGLTPREVEILSLSPPG
jgi:hypothetical protein